MEKQYENIFIKRFLYFNLFVIKGIDGDILIDTGFIGTKKRIEKWLNKFNIKLIILTHAHIDHTWNTSYLKEKYNCKIAMGTKDIKNLDNRQIKSKASEKKYKTWTKLMNFGMKHFKSKNFNIDIPLKNNQELNIYGINLKIFNLSGHTNGSIGILFKKYLFAGDALVNRRKKITIAYQNQNNKKATKSLNKIKKIKPEIIFMGHDHEIKYEKLKEVTA